MLLRNSIYSTLTTLVNFLAPLIVLPVLTGAVSPHSLGLLFYHESLARYLSVFILLGIPIYGVRELSKMYECSRTVQASFIFSVTIIQLILSFLVSVVWLTVFDRNFFNVLTLALGLSTSFSLEWVFHGLEKFKRLALRNVILKVVFVSIIFFTIKREEDVYIYFVIIVLNSAFIMIWNVLSLSIILKEFKWRDVQLRTHLRPLSLLFSTILVISVYTMLDVLLLKFFSTESEIAIYSVGSRIPKAMVLLVSSFLLVVIPRLNSFFKSDLKKFDKALSLSFGIILYIGFPMSVLLSINSKWILDVLVSQEAYSESLVVFKILSLLPIIIGLSNFFGIQLLTTYGFERDLLFGAICGAVVSLVFNIMLISDFGASGAAFSYLLAEIVVVIVLVFRGWRRGILKDRKINMPGRHRFVLFIYGIIYVSLIFVSLDLEVVVFLNLSMILSFLCLKDKYLNLYTDMRNG